tara:strand:+ start:40 stop:264 length:225 start_codon:yes stop_codon:yes gene_type:complete
MNDSNNNSNDIPSEFQSANWPAIPESIITRLNECFPERSADLTWDEKQVWFASGQRSVVRFLNQVFLEQNEKVL